MLNSSLTEDFGSVLAPDGSTDTEDDDDRVGLLPPVPVVGGGVRGAGTHPALFASRAPPPEAASALASNPQHPGFGGEDPLPQPHGLPPPPPPPKPPRHFAPTEQTFSRPPETSPALATSSAFGMSSGSTFLFGSGSVVPPGPEQQSQPRELLRPTTLQPQEWGRKDAPAQFAFSGGDNQNPPVAARQVARKKKQSNGGTSSSSTSSLSAAAQRKGKSGGPAGATERLVATGATPAAIVSPENQKIFLDAMDLFKGTGGRQKDLDEAVKLFLYLSSVGSAHANYMLAGCFKNGWGVQQSPVDALRYYQAAVAQRHTGAMIDLAMCYENGELGLVKSPQKTWELNQLAASSGDPVAQFNMGVSYDEGLTVGQDFRKAVYWYRLSADQGNADAQNCLGICYLDGLGGLQKDYLTAYRLFKRAADQGNAGGLANLKEDDLIAGLGQMATQGTRPAAEAKAALAVCHALLAGKPLPRSAPSDLNAAPAAVAPSVVQPRAVVVGEVSFLLSASVLSFARCWPIFVGSRVPFN